MSVDTSAAELLRSVPIGAEYFPGRGVHFRVWAPEHHDVEVVIEARHSRSRERIMKLRPEGKGYFSAFAPHVEPGAIYRYRLDGTPEAYPDPASFFQPEGPLGPSEVVDLHSYVWRDAHWKGIRIKGQVIYEMHIGTFTPEGTFSSASRQLAALAETGITVVEIMPLADFPGDFGWGYDGTDFFAPTRLYGRPDDVRAFIDEAHSCNIAVIQDVVYNHYGIGGNFFQKFSRFYVSTIHWNEWGDAVNFDGEHCEPVREYVLANVDYWISQFHFDGLRLDATQQIFDHLEPNIMQLMVETARKAAGERKVIILAENEPQHSMLVRPKEEGGYGMDGLWNDDFHHTAMVALSKHNEAYYTDYFGQPQEFISAAKWGFLYQGQRYSWQKQRRGSPSLDLEPEAFILYLQNHDQVANTSNGLRMQFFTSPGLFRALTALLLLFPGTPMLFQGQEFAASSPFFYFGNVAEALAESIHNARLKFLSQFRTIALAETQAAIRRPSDRATFELSKIDHSERVKHAEAYALHCDLLKLRREDPVLAAQKKGAFDGAVLGSHAFVMRFFDNVNYDRLLVVNLGRDLRLEPAPEPLLAPLENAAWDIQWSSESHAYGGNGTPALEEDDIWRIPGEAAIVLRPVPRKAESKR